MGLFFCIMQLIKGSVCIIPNKHDLILSKLYANVELTEDKQNFQSSPHHMYGV